jgi:hypothetical protein
MNMSVAMGWCHCRVALADVNLRCCNNNHLQEAQVLSMVVSTRDLPDELAAHGSVTVPHDELAILIGRVFLQKTALNLQVRCTICCSAVACLSTSIVLESQGFHSSCCQDQQL